MPILNMIAQGSGWWGSNVWEPTNLYAIDSSNTSIDITWTDNSLQTIPPSTFGKSVLVRKVGSAPTSPSDWTTVVTETVMNTYQNNAYTDTWLTEWTTYYYQVFSYSADWGITYWTPVSATPSSWWHPWVNTVAYYEFDNNLDDSSWNWFNQTLASWAVVYWTASWGGKYAYFDSSTYTANSSLGSIDYSSDSYTVSFYRQPKTIFSSWAHAVFDWAMNGRDPAWIRMVDSLASRGVSNTFSATVDTWYYITTTRDKADVYFYVNGQLIGSWTWGGSGSYTPTFRFNAIWNATQLTNDNYLWQFIIEDKLRTAQEIAVYFNKTKADYWIS